MYDEMEKVEDDKSPIDDSSNIYIGERYKKKRSFRGSLASYIILALLASFIGGFSSSFINPYLHSEAYNNQGQKPKDYTGQPVIINPNDDYNTVTAVVKKAMGSVVGITTLETKQFTFGLRDVEGLGSGVIVDSEGYILTNSHVVADGNAKSITVLLDNGDQVAGNVLWSDPLLDLAIVKVEITNLPAATLGNSDELEVGELAIAIGNPLGLEFQRSVTSGIISGLNRAVQLDQGNIIEDLIQTDASINPGNSGGPLLNKNGEVIGLNTAKIKTAEGLGFSIPINTAKGIIEEIIDKGSYKTVQLGISGMGIKEYQSRNGIDYGYDKGIIVLDVTEETPAARADLIRFDIILSIDDIEVDTVEGLKKALYNYREGDTARLTILRNKETLQLEIHF